MRHTRGATLLPHVGQGLAGFGSIKPCQSWPPKVYENGDFGGWSRGDKMNRFPRDTDNHHTLDSASPLLVYNGFVLPHVISTICCMIKESDRTFKLEQIRGDIFGNGEDGYAIVHQYEGLFDGLLWL